MVLIKKILSESVSLSYVLLLTTDFVKVTMTVVMSNRGVAMFFLANYTHQPHYYIIRYTC